MKPLVILGVVVMLAGVAGLVIPAITVQDTDTVAEIGDLEITATTNKQVPIPIWAGIAAVAAGGIMVAAGSRRRA